MVPPSFAVLVTVLLLETLAAFPLRRYTTRAAITKTRKWISARGYHIALVAAIATLSLAMHTISKDIILDATDANTANEPTFTGGSADLAVIFVILPCVLHSAYLAQRIATALTLSRATTTTQTEEKQV